MQVDFIILGQGLAGTWLSYFLMKDGAKVLVIDAERSQHSASSAASGLINPITGKRLARQPMAEQVLPFASEAYAAMGTLLGTSLLHTVPIHTFFGSTEEAEFFKRKSESSHADLLFFDSRMEGAEHFHTPFGTGTIYPAQLVQIEALLGGWRQHLSSKKALLETQFEWADCSLGDDEVCYGLITAGALIDCRGAAGAEHPYFRKLPFALNKGEVITASIPDLPSHAVFKHQHLAIVPWRNGKFWIGSTFDWNFTDELPTAAFREKATRILKEWLRLPVVFESHFAAIRPATVTRDAFVGMHPYRPVLGILNGLGSKGCSLAPFLAKGFADALLHKKQLLPQTDVARYTGILSR